MGEWSDGHSAGQSRVAATFGSVNTEEERLPLHRPSRAETLTRSLSRPLFCPPTTTVRNLLYSLPPSNLVAYVNGICMSRAQQPKQ